MVFEKNGKAPYPKIPKPQAFTPVKKKKYIHIYIYTGCHRRNGSNFGRVFLMLNYTDITQNTYVPS